MVSIYCKSILFRGVLCLCALLLGSVAALALTRVTTPSFGVIFAGDSSRQFVLNTNGTVTGSGAGDHVSGAVAGQFTVSNTSHPAAINILVDNISSLGGLTVNQALCSYNDGAQQSCDGGWMSVTSVSSTTLKVGLDLTTSAAHPSQQLCVSTWRASATYWTALIFAGWQCEYEQ